MSDVRIVNCLFGEKNLQPIDVTSEKPNIQIASPSSTNICVDGCKAHQNWIQFYLVTRIVILKTGR